MKVAVTVFGALRDHLPPDAPSNSVTLEVADDATVGDVVDELGAPRRLAFAVLVDGTTAKLGDSVHEGAEVTLMPPFAGG
jgi:molybdopterin converting factor small subunit